MKLAKENLASIVRDTRRGLGLTQSQLAQRAHCSQRLISDLENGSSAQFDKVFDVLYALELHVEVCPQQIKAQAEVAELEKQVETMILQKTSKPVIKQRPRLKDLL